MKILFISDIHLDRDHPERTEALKLSCDKAAQLGCEHIIIGGDMFHKPDEARGIGQELGNNIFDNYELDFHIIPGNHDMAAFKKEFYLGKRVTIYRDYEIKDLGGTRFYFIPFKEGSGYFTRSLNWVSENPGDKNIAVMHANLTDISYQGDEKHYEYMDCELSDFAGKGIDLVLAGHIHSGFKKLGYDGGYFVYAGSPVSVTSKETGVRSAVTIDTETLEITRHDLETFHYLFHREEIFLNDEEGFQRIKDLMDVHSENSNLIIEVYGVLKGDVNGFIDRLDALSSDDDRLRIIPQLKYAGDIESHPLFSRFREHLESREFPASKKDLMIREFIRAAGGEI